MSSNQIDKIKMNTKKHKKCVQNAFVQWAKVRFPGIDNPNGSYSNTRIPLPMTCITIPNDEKFNLYTSFLSVSLCSFSAFWRAENANSAQTNIRQKLYVVNNFFIYLCWD